MLEAIGVILIYSKCFKRTAGTYASVCYTACKTDHLMICNKQPKLSRDGCLLEQTSPIKNRVPNQLKIATPSWAYVWLSYFSEIKI